MVLLIDKDKNTMEIDINDIRVLKMQKVKKHTTMKEFNDEIKNFLKSGDK